jgi:hypothetical protein
MILPITPASFGAITRNYSGEQITMNSPTIQAICTTQAFPGKVLSQNHWVATSVQLRSNQPIRLQDLITLEDPVQLMYSYTGVVHKILGVAKGWVDIQVQQRTAHGAIDPIILTIPHHCIRLPFHWRIKYAWLQTIRAKRFRHPMVMSFAQPAGPARHTRISHIQSPEPLRLQSRQGGRDILAALDAMAAEYPEDESCEGIPEDLSEDDDFSVDIPDWRPHHYRYIDSPQYLPHYSS